MNQMCWVIKHFCFDTSRDACQWFAISNWFLLQLIVWHSLFMSTKTKFKLTTQNIIFIITIKVGFLPSISDDHLKFIFS